MITIDTARAGPATARPSRRKAKSRPRCNQPRRMEDPPVLPGTSLHAGAALPAVQCVTAQCQRRFDSRARRHRKRAAQFRRIFYRHCRALRKIRAHRVRRVAQQGYAASRHFIGAAHGRPVVQRPQPPTRHSLHEVPQRRAQRADRAMQLGGHGLLVPVARRPRRTALDDRDHVEPLAGAAPDTPPDACAGPARP